MPVHPRCPSIVPALLALAAVCTGACRISPIVRIGDIEPPPRQRMLVDIWVRPVDRRGPPREALGAFGDQTVASLALTPPPAVASRVVRGELASPIQDWDTPAWKAPVKPVDLALDARRVESIYAARGFFHARTHGWRIVDLTAQRARAEFDIEEGKQLRVKEVRFVGMGGATDDPEADRRLRELEPRLPGLVPFARGDVWTEDAYAAGLEAIGRELRSAGFLYARVTGDNWVSKDTDRGLVVYSIDHGPLVRADGPPRVLNNHMVDKERALVRVGIKQGDILDRTRLRDAERRLTDLGVLLSVQLRPVLTAPTPIPEATHEGMPPIPEVAPQRGVVALDLELQEAPRWDFTSSAAVSLEATNLSFGLPIAFTHLDVGSQLWRLGLSAKPAISFADPFHGLKAPAGAVDAAATFDVPSFFAEYLKLSTGLTYLRDPTLGTTRQEFGGFFEFSFPIVGPLSARLGWSIDYLDYLDRIMVTTSEALAGADLRIRNRDWTAWLQTALLLDLRDSPHDTRMGFYAELSARVAAPWLLSWTEFERLQLDLRGYVTFKFLPFVTFAAHLKGGIVFFPGGQGTPLTARFLAGGPTSHHAFDTNRMGDYVCQSADASGLFVNGACSDTARDRNYVGGNYLLQANIETRFRFDWLAVTPFVDIGNLWSRPSDIDLGNLDLIVSLGAALQLNVFGLQIGLDASRRVDVRKSDPVFHFAFGQSF